MTHSTTIHSARLVLLGLWMLCASACAGGGDFARGNYLTPPGAVLTTCEPGAAPKSWAVVIGVDYYEDPRISDLSGAVNDAWTFYHTLASPAGGAIPENRLRLLLGEEATRANIEQALGGEFLARACPQDQIIVYFAGHGSPEPGRPDEAFLLTQDTDVTNMLGTALSMQQLAGFLKWRLAHQGELLLLVDACHSGSIKFPDRGGEFPTGMVLEEEGVGLGVRSNAVNTQLESVASDKGWGVISAAASDEKALEVACTLGGQKYAGGLFTCTLIQAIEGRADANADKAVSLGELYDYLSRAVVGLTAGKQRPKLSGNMSQETVLFRAFDPQPIEIPSVPECYRFESRPRPLAPYISPGLWLTGGAMVAAGGLSVAAFLNGEGINNTTANNPGSRTEAQFQSDKDTQDLLGTLAASTGIAAGALAATTATIWAADALGTLECREQIYTRPPWFQLGALPLPGGGGAAVTLTWE